MLLIAVSVHGRCDILFEHRDSGFLRRFLDVYFLQHIYQRTLPVETLRHQQFVVQRTRIGQSADAGFLFTAETTEPILRLLQCFAITELLPLFRRANQVFLAEFVI